MIRVRDRCAAFAFAMIVAASSAGAQSRPSAAPVPAATRSSAPLVRFWTDAGTFDVRLDAASAPRTVANFLWYVEQGAYTGGRFYRTVTTQPDNQPANDVKIDVVQGGIRPDFAAAPPIPLEPTSVTRLRHEDGTISMARAGPNTATGEFFLCVGPQPALDFGGKRQPDGQGFAAFGRVVRGMEIVRTIHRAKAQGQALQPPIAIRRVEVVPQGR